MTKKEALCVKKVWEYYKRHGRHSLPWRLTKNPYHILVSEIMLQQTQVDRVLLKYNSFLKRFPTIRELSEASFGDVLRAWQGLGYNRRARMLHECARQIVNERRGLFSKTPAELMQLPGVGHYTAGAIMAFAWNMPVTIIETNIRAVIIYHFFKDKIDISDKQVFQLTGIVLDTENPREWYYAMMDYGAHIKKTFGNPNNRSKHYTKQSAFKGSDREIRGAILRLLAVDSYTRAQFLKKLPFEDVRIDAQLGKLFKEEMLMKKNSKYALPV